jgi:hypothetical protein
MGKLGDLSKAKTFNLPVGWYQVSFRKNSRSLLGIIKDRPSDLGTFNILIEAGRTNTILVAL